MPNSHEFIVDVNRLLAKLDDSGDLNTGIEVANQVVRLLGTHDTKEADLVVDEQVLQLPNAERYDRWFHNHPWMGGERAAFELADAKDIPIQSKFYWLQKRSRQFIAGSVHFTENWEDADYTHNDNFKVGIDFFLTPNGRSVIVALSNRGNIRVVELQHKLNNTQVDIFTKWRDAIQISSTEALHTTLWESFKLQSVNKDFYTGVANSFTELLQHLKSIGRDEEDAKLFASRLLGRLLFVWFLRKKDIIDESLGYFDASSDNATNYYKRSLERLFFNTLNTPIDDRDEFKKELQKSLFPESDNEPQAKLFQVDNKTPYLNGGLFEPHDNDWYKDSDLTFPEGFFTNLYNHFDQFNFTTDESSPEYEQVAIDPEMLGRVFESLLATQVDETGQQARKAKGAFYTPREIVSYMCRESLRNYLYGAKEDDERYKKAVNELLDRSDHEWAGAGTNSRRDAVPKEYRTVIVDALDTVTVLDPACGSGAFPMGMLQLLIKTYERLEGRFDPYKTKLQIVQNNIFGVDIEPMAVEISRLRAWLSLIVDEDDSRDVAPLPNLDFKFVCANSLIPLDDSKADLFNDPELHKQLAEIRQTYFNARKPHTKKAAQQKYYKLAGSNTGLFDNLRTRQLKSFDPFINSHPADFFNADQMFGIENGFDIVIGNPPYYIENDDKNRFNGLRALECYQGKMNVWYLFGALGVDLLKDNGTLSYIATNNWTTNAGASKWRNKLLSETKILSLIDFGNYMVFEAASQQTMVMIFSKNKEDDAYRFDYRRINGNKPTNNNFQSALSLSEFENNEYLTPLIIRAERKNELLTFSDEESSSILQKMISKAGTYLTDKEVANGIHPHYDYVNKKTLKKLGPSYKVGDGIFVLNSDEVEHLNLAEHEKSMLKPYYTTTELGRYRSNRANKEWIIYTDSKYKNPSSMDGMPALKKHLDQFTDVITSANHPYGLHRAREKKFFSGKAIVALRKSPLRPSFTYVDFECYVSATFYIIKTERMNSKFLTGFLNSKLIAFWLKNKGKMQGQNYQIDKAPLLTIPIASVSDQVQESISDYVDSIYNGTSMEEVEPLIDSLIYESYGMSPDEVAFIEAASVSN